MKPEIARRLKRATRTLEAAEVLLSDGYLAEAATRMYYGMFYAATAMHLAEGRSYRSHESLIAEFGRFVLSGRVDRELHLWLKDAYELRNQQTTTMRVRRSRLTGRTDFSSMLVNS
jgi:uncharacterized protein (UPF0332 family)